MTYLNIPRGFVHFSLATAIALALASWLDYELTPVTSGGSWFVLGAILAVARISLVLAFCIGAIGWGGIAFRIGRKFFRAPRQLRSPSSLVRTSKSIASVLVAILVMALTINFTSDVMARLDILAWCTIFIGFETTSLVVWRWSLRSVTAKKWMMRVSPKQSEHREPD